MNPRAEREDLEATQLRHEDANCEATAGNGSPMPAGRATAGFAYERAVAYTAFVLGRPFRFANRKERSLS